MTGSEVNGILEAVATRIKVNPNSRKTNGFNSVTVCELNVNQSVVYTLYELSINYECTALIAFSYEIRCFSE